MDYLHKQVSNLSVSRKIDWILENKEKVGSVSIDSSDGSIVIILVDRSRFWIGAGWFDEVIKAIMERV